MRKGMGIFIPSKSRAHDQVTIKSIPEARRDSTFIVVPFGQAGEYQRSVPNGRIMTTPESVQGIHATRQWIMEEGARAQYSSVCMMDDDLVFAKRRDDDRTLFKDMLPEDYVTMFNMLESSLETYAHAGILGREGGNRITDHVKHNTRMLRILAYDVDTFFRHKCDFTRMQLMEDFDVTLQLLKAGYGNQLLCDYVSNQKRSNAPGGCSTYRTKEMQGEAANRLARLHPGFVRVVTKKTKAAWGWDERQDVVIQWKAAFEQGTRERLQREIKRG